MQKIQTISLHEARLLALHNQMLVNNHSHRGKTGVLKIIEQLGYIQIDTISVVERSHRHILWTRVPDYREEMLEELIDKDKKVFEYWSHAAAFIPIRDYRFTYYRKRMFTYYNKSWGEWEKKNKKVIKLVYDRVKSEGPLQSRDFAHREKRGKWWDWKPSKYALEYLFHTGKLMLKARKNFQKIYDLSERILPPGVNNLEPTDEEHAGHLIMSSIKQHGIITKSEIGYQRFYPEAAFNKMLKQLSEEKQITKINIESLKPEYYTTEAELEKLSTLSEHDKQVHILSPFDNSVIRRKRLNSLFGFDYVIECYVPRAKREFGYYCMPVIYSNKFIGRMDMKAERANSTLRIINIFPEKGIKKSVLKKLVKPKLQELAEFAGCVKVKMQ